MRILSLCTSAGLWDKAWIEAGHEVIAGCEIVDHKRLMYLGWCPSTNGFLEANINNLSKKVKGIKFDGVIGGIPCQSRSRLRGIKTPKFGDLLPQAEAVLKACKWDWFILENTSALEMSPEFNCKWSKMDAMNYQEPHQSRTRFFTHSQELNRPAELFSGSIDDLKAYPCVAGRLYGPKRGAWLQGWPEFADLPFSCPELQEALADGVPRGLADAWIREVERVYG